MAAPVRILYFAWLRERAGRAEEELELPPGIESVASLMGWLRARDPAGERAFAEASLVRCALNQELVGPDAPVAPGDEVAFFPPVTGG